MPEEAWHVVMQVVEDIKGLKLEWSGALLLPPLAAPPKQEARELYFAYGTMYELHIRPLACHAGFLLTNTGVNTGNAAAWRCERAAGPSASGAIRGTGDEQQWGPLVAFECRGLEPVSFQPQANLRFFFFWNAQRQFSC